MLIGEHLHTIDDKSRVSLPSKFRKEMGSTVVIAPGIDSCLFIFTLKGWKESQSAAFGLAIRSALSSMFSFLKFLVAVGIGGRQHGGQGGAVAQVQVPVVGAADGQ